MIDQKWPKFVVHAEGTWKWYIKRFSATEAVCVNGSTENPYAWESEEDGYVENGTWILVTESEALARLKPAEPITGDRLCEVCGIGFILPSGVCDHCDRPEAKPAEPDYREATMAAAQELISGFAKPVPLALDVSLEKARALHRVWRALNDGDCPKCHRHRPATAMFRGHEFLSDGPAIACPNCNFHVTHREIEEIEKMFAPAMDAAVKIFEEWRAEQQRAD